MTRTSKPFIDARWTVPAVLFAIFSLSAATMRPALADGLARGTGAYSRGDYARAVRELTPAALRGNARAQARLGFMYENGFGVPQNYGAAANLYQNAAAQGDAFAQSRLGLSYDKGHGVPQNAILSYKWLDLAAAKAKKRERDYYLRLRNAVASKMTSDQIVEGQRLALIWTTGRW
ncbi:Sel1 repeat protein [mine drainage metagenome]|uniref:Sel1 repeat protein n=1 Tax=mine drainage metagenome TaxID=410659 RepID=A0A1J5PKD4_9ZZZZ